VNVDSWVFSIDPAGDGSGFSLCRVDGFGVSAARLQEAARSAASVADDVPASDIAAAVRAVAASLPGGITAAEGELLADGWAASCAAVAAAISAQSTAMAAAAVTYGAADADVGAALEGVRW
jgi:hypothetical protein